MLRVLLSSDTLLQRPVECSSVTVYDSVNEKLSDSQADIVGVSTASERLHNSQIGIVEMTTRIFFALLQKTNRK